MVRYLICLFVRMLIDNRIFILEGLVPIAFSLVVWKLLPDSPETAKFLTKKEKEFIINRLALDTGSGRGRVTNSDKIGMHHVIAALKEYKIWGAWVMFWANTIGVGSAYEFLSSLLTFCRFTALRLQYRLSLKDSATIRPLLNS